MKPYLLFALTVFVAAPLLAQETVLFDMDSVRHQPGETTDKDNHKVPVGTVTLVPGKFNKAVEFTFAATGKPGFMTAGVRATPDWNQSAGFSFWVKGDGSASFGGIELIDRDDFSKRYAYCFPIDSAEWRKITVPWRDVIPELSSPLVDAKSGYAPSGFGNFWFGKWFYWRDYPAHRFAIDQVVLEKQIDLPPIPATPPGLQRLREKLAAHKPITIVTMGDSLTDTHHWANRKSVWCDILAKDLKARYGSEVKIVNPAIGGTTLSQNLVLTPRWLKEAPSPDLVTVFFGGNDWDSNVRGQRYAEYLRLAVDRIRLQTGGSADIILLTTCPGHARWETCRELEEAARTVAQEKRTGLADVAGACRKLGTPDEALKLNFWVWDKVHLGEKGHQVVAKTVQDAIAQ